MTISQKDESAWVCYMLCVSYFFFFYLSALCVSSIVEPCVRFSPSYFFCARQDSERKASHSLV